MAKPTLLTYAGKFLLHPTDPTKNLAKLFPYIDIIVNTTTPVAPPCNRGTIVQTDYAGYHYRWTCDDYTDVSEAFMNTTYPDPDPGVAAQVIFTCYHFENVVNMDRMFLNCDWIDHIQNIHIGRYLQSAQGMCYGCTHSVIPGITVNYNNRVLRDVSYMFYDCQEFDAAHAAYSAMSKMATANTMNTNQCFYNVPEGQARLIPESWGGLMHE